MSTRITAIGRQFNRSSSGSYDRHSSVQRSMADRLVQILKGWVDDSYKEGLNLLEIGCGTGALTEILLKEWSSFVSITALDIAPKMIKVAEQRVLSSAVYDSESYQSSSTRLQFLEADVEVWAIDAPSASFDLIISNACFQWLSNQVHTLGHLRRLLRPGGMLVFTTFGPHTFHELHKSFHEVYRASGLEPQRHGLSFQSTDQWKEWLNEVGFSSIQYEREVRKETYPTVRDFLFSVKGMGASSSEAVALPGISTRRLFAKMYQEYEDKFGIQEGIIASYDLLMIQASAKG
ncbi:malonyl-ACP O-methyltransferase BioC [Paenibacillus sp. LjRoot56]|uniref:malonyl-ACP O-methyltransferase BioC n=1 Tax=Paenibacillus sp. LjRoot56 TaxID=3342333 RepID=UPI003ED08C6F